MKIDRSYFSAMACLFFVSSCTWVNVVGPNSKTTTSPGSEHPEYYRDLFSRSNIVLVGSYAQRGHGIFNLDIDGTLISALETSLAETARWASWSSVNREILFDSGGDIYLANPTTGETNLILSASPLDTNPIWAPSGDKFAFERDNGGSICIGDVNGQVRTLLPAENNKAYHIGNWSPDGGEIVYAELVLNPGQEGIATAPEYRLMIINVETGKTSPLFDANEALEFRSSTNPVFSPDGSAVAFQAISGKNVRIFLAGSEEGKVKELTSEPGNYSNPVWSPDGQYILAFTGGENENYYSIFTTQGILVRTVHGLDGLVTQWVLLPEQND